MGLPRLTRSAPPPPQEQTLRADPAAQLALLDVQRLDSRLDQLRAGIARPPEAAELAQRQQQRTALEGDLADRRLALDDLRRAQRKAEADVEQVRGRRVRDQQRLDSGSVGAKDLERLQHELVSLDKRISDLEDVQLEVMERLETAEAELAERERARAALADRVAEVTQARDARVASLQDELGRRTSERAAAAAGLPDDLLGLYDRLRSQKDGVGAALLRARRCEGCSLQLDHAEIAAIARTAPDEVVRCEECSRILVRTAESGL